VGESQKQQFTIHNHNHHTAMKEKKSFGNLFGEEELWKKEWIDMPEFIQYKKEPYTQIIIRFENEKDLQDFAKIIGQKLTNKTKSIWHPFKSHWGGVKKVWVNEK
jgi:hypothetical protein